MSHSCFSFPCASPLSWILVPKPWSGLWAPYHVLELLQGLGGCEQLWEGTSQQVPQFWRQRGRVLQLGTHLPSRALEIGLLTQGLWRETIGPHWLLCPGSLPRASRTRSFSLTRRSWCHSPVLIKLPPHAEHCILSSASFSFLPLLPSSLPSSIY